MMSQLFSAVLRKSVTVRLGILAGIIGILIGCGGGGDGGIPVSGVSGGSESNSPPGNQSPIATISSPADTFSNEGENIIFSGAGTDDEDGQLNDGALVWTSSIDGTIGIGSTLITSSLTPGDHDITLSATDSNGAAYTTDPILVQVEPTRFLKMGLQTTGVPDASNAFDGFHDTAAILSTAVTEFIHFKAYIGGEGTFFFSVKLGASTIGSSLAIEGLTADDTWQPIDDIDLDADKTVTLKITDAQAYKDSDGYINLRASWVNGQSPDTVPIYELWRADPVYAGPKTMGVDNVELAFDGDRSKPATITNTLTNSGDLLHFKAYVGLGQSNTFVFNVLLNSIGYVHFLVIEVEDFISGNWEPVEYLNLDTDNARTVSIQDVQNYLDADGYISLRAYWDTIIRPYDPSGTHVKVFEIWRIDPFFVVPNEDLLGWIAEPENAVDGALDSYTTMYFYWNEYVNEDFPQLQNFLYVQTYVGDASPIDFSVLAAISAPPDALLIVDGEIEPGRWSVVRPPISLGNLKTTPIELSNAREFVTADGYLSLRLRWESDTIDHDAYIHEIWREEN